MRSTEHFHPAVDKKLVCTCCGKGDLAVATFIVLEVVRIHFGQPVTITSACRCPKHNKHIGGGVHSQHLTDVPTLTGWTTTKPQEPTAVDIQVKDVPARAVYAFLCTLPYANLLGLGKYNTFTHIDTRGYTARW